MRFPRLAVLFALACALPARAQPPDPAGTVDMKHLPWKDGEALTYSVQWGGSEAAEGVFIARQKPDHWQFSLALESKGLVTKIYPFNALFYSAITPGPWRSTEYSELRLEPKRTIKEKTHIDYATHIGTRVITAPKKDTKTFTFAEDSIDDVGSMLYHIRAEEWKPGDHRVMHVYESDSEKEALIDCQAVETRAFGIWPKQSLIRIVALPGKGTHHRGWLKLWMTNDALRLPIHAELNFRYGGFDIDLIKAPVMPTVTKQ